MNTDFANYFFSQSMHQLFNRKVEIISPEMTDAQKATTKLYQRLALKTANEN